MAPCVRSMVECSTAATAIGRGCSEGEWCGSGLLRDEDARRIECQGKARAELRAATVGVERRHRRSVMMGERMDTSHEGRERVSRAPIPRVVIVGGGFGGLYAARGLARAPVTVTVVDKHNYHLFRPMLYQVATGLLSSDEVAAP